MKNYWLGKRMTVNPQSFRDMVKSSFRQFREDYAQHDAQELLGLLLDAMHDELQAGRRQTEKRPSAADADVPETNAVFASRLKSSESATRQRLKHLSDNRSIILDEFEGQMKSMICCRTCGSESVSFQPFRFLQLPIPESKSNRRNLRSTVISIINCIEVFMASDTLDEDNRWMCPTCSVYRSAKKSLSVEKFPPCVIVHLKRFVNQELTLAKIDRNIEFPVENLDLSILKSGQQQESMKYDLESVICHEGDLERGHYTAYSKHPVSAEWHHFDDERVEKREPHGTKCTSAYVLFYRRKESHVQPLLPRPRSNNDIMTKVSPSTAPKGGLEEVDDKMSAKETSFQKKKPQEASEAKLKRKNPPKANMKTAKNEAAMDDDAPIVLRKMRFFVPGDIMAETDSVKVSSFVKASAAADRCIMTGGECDLPGLGLHFNQVNEVSVLEPDVAEQTNQLAEECKESMVTMEELRKFIQSLEAGESVKLEAIATRGILKSAVKQRKVKQHQSQALVLEKRMELAMLKDPSHRFHFSKVSRHDSELSDIYDSTDGKAGAARDHEPGKSNETVLLRSKTCLKRTRPLEEMKSTVAKQVKGDVIAGDGKEEPCGDD